MAASKVMKFGNHIKELRIHFCQSSSQSKGVRDFVEKHYVTLKQNNPRFPILIRECSGVQPRVYARYALGKESSVALTNLKADDILNQINTMAKC